MNNAYSPKWRKLFRTVTTNLNHDDIVKEGVYTMVGGPNFETPAELLMLRVCGVDAVGESIPSGCSRLTPGCFQDTSKCLQKRHNLQDARNSWSDFGHLIDAAGDFGPV